MNGVCNSFDVYCGYSVNIDIFAIFRVRLCLFFTDFTRWVKVLSYLTYIIFEPVFGYKDCSFIL